ncbi:MAG TPA: SDR family oxidoreductase [Terriglobales bacterium]|nr:SDR family oxidoreductase [Terriglobales bacterium]
MTSTLPVRDLFDLEKKVVIVTGGLGQLGQQFTGALLEGGARVAVFDQGVNDECQPKELCARASSDRLLLVAADVTNRDSLESALAQVLASWGSVFGLVNAAALDSPPDAPAEENGPFENYPEQSWDRVVEVNLKGVFLSCQVIGGQMARAGKGSIINIGSTYGVVSPDQRIYEYRRSSGAPFYKPVAYSASKSGLLNLTRYLATYWAQQNVRVNMLTLGGVFNHQDQNFLRGYCQRVPMGRMARADEYNGAIIFLLSAAASYMTGSNLVIDGGWTAW